MNVRSIRHNHFGTCLTMLLATTAVIAPVASVEAQVDDEMLQHRTKLAYVLLWKQDFDAAEKEFRNVLEHDASYADANLGLGLALERQKKYDEALDILNRIPTDASQYQEAQFAKARILAAQGRHKPAITIYEKLDSTGQLDEKSRVEYIKTLAWDRQYEKALSKINKMREDPRIALEKPELSFELSKIEGQILVWSRRPEQAIPKLREALVKAPNDDDVRLDLARALLLTGENDEAEQVLAKLSDNPGNEVKVILLKADMMLIKENHAEAIKLLKHGLSKHPEENEIKRRLAEVLHWQNDADNAGRKRAIQLYRELLSQPEYKDDKKLRTQLAETLSWIGRYDEAAEEYRKVLGD